MKKKARPERLVKKLGEYINEGEITLTEAAFGIEVSVQTIINWVKKKYSPRSLILINRLEKYLKKVERKIKKLTFNS